MELKLNVYNKREIVKTHTTDTYDVELGVCEDLLKLLNLEKYANEETLKKVPVTDIITAVMTNYDKFIELLHDIFPDLTEEERRHTKLIEIRDVFINLAKYTLKKLFDFNSKN